MYCPSLICSMYDSTWKQYTAASAHKNTASVSPDLRHSYVATLVRRVLRELLVAKNTHTSSYLGPKMLTEMDEVDEIEILQ